MFKTLRELAENKGYVVLFVLGITYGSAAIDILAPKQPPLPVKYYRVQSAHICLTQPQLRNTNICKGVYK